MNRNFTNLNIYLNRLMQDIYPQPEDEGHTAMAVEVFSKWFSPSPPGKTILDVGCGDSAFMQSHFESIGMEYTGIALRTDNPSILNMDFTFLEFGDNSFDCIFARHSLEHSPMPLLTLMEWHRVSSHLLCVVAPDPEHYGWAGKNHYSVMNREQLSFLLGRAGWSIIWEDSTQPTEIRFMCEKGRIIYE